LKISDSRKNNVISYLQKAHGLTVAQAADIAEKGSYSFEECNDIANALPKKAAAVAVSHKELNHEKHS
jgi:hypothetical protein